MIVLLKTYFSALLGNINKLLYLYQGYTLRHQRKKRIYFRKVKKVKAQKLYTFFVFQKVKQKKNDNKKHINKK